ncbi:MAG: DUF4230 domain-containing protein [Chloroherpetonaceae bacterium]|nr:DUF4230 domain-containing protein [Chthonomonadaceae bacterium]MDW8207587.1 DUF4230 domain-containing protein [Chloroherpetonaceae bacterium]
MPLWPCLWKLKNLQHATRAPASGHPGTMRHTPGAGCALLALTTLLVLLLYGSLRLLFAPQRHDSQIDTRPVLLAIRQLGHLHTASYHMKDVLRFETAQKPEGWLAGIPGAEQIVQWATRNRALIIAEGTVEAGIDLSQITPQSVTRIPQPDGRIRLRVTLPPVTLYPPTVRLHVESSHSGPFWKDENLIPKAQAEAGRRFLQAAEKAGLRATAAKNAIDTLRAMQNTLELHNVEFVSPETSGTSPAP